MSQQVLENLVQSLPVMAKSLIGTYASQITSNPTFQAVSEVISQLAEKDGMAIGEFLQSGRAIEVFRGLAVNGEVPAKHDIKVQKCPKCHHISYGEIHE